MRVLSSRAISRSSINSPEVGGIRRRRLRQRSRRDSCDDLVSRYGGGVYVSLHTIRGITPGQSVAMYTSANIYGIQQALRH